MKKALARALILIGCALLFSAMWLASQQAHSPITSTILQDGAASFMLAVRRIGAETHSGALGKFECGRCHTISGQPPLPDEQSCVSCHQGIFAGRYDRRFSAPTIERWKSHIRHLTAVPSLVGISQRLRRDWVLQFLRSPKPIRPHLGALMPQLPLSETDAEEIVALLYKDHEHAPSDMPPGNPLAGEKVFSARGCDGCHRYSGVDPGPVFAVEKDAREIPDAVKLAPDLIHTRKRMVKSAAARWLREPAAITPGTLMPPVALSQNEERDLLTFLFEHPAREEHPPRPFESLPLLNRPVHFREVQEKVTKKICWHCHSDPVPMKGEGGPGNTGGFGYPGAGLDLSNLPAIRRGAVRKDVEKRSMLEKEPDGIPRIVKHLIARHRELEGTPDPGHLGMPLGLPPLPPEDIQLLWSWIEQGAKE